MVPKADHLTLSRNRTRTRTLWGDQCLDAVACEGSRLISPARMLLCLEGLPSTNVMMVGGMRTVVEKHV